MDARKYWTQCRLHDWFYMMSDDPGVFRDGAESEALLLNLAFKNPDLTSIYEAWCDFHYGSGPKPAEPKLED